jgi:predicted RNA binding protein YcfA (HicA-like mRNA interferase family)
MSKLPVLKTRDLIKVLKKLGFERRRQSGSHIFFSHPDGRTTVVPRHNGKDISRGLLSEILGDIEMKREEFLKLLRGRR